MRVYRTTAVLSVLCLLLAPTPARAWWGWLDNLSGPGPFNGVEFDYELFCFNTQTSPEAVRAAVVDAQQQLLSTPNAADLTGDFNKLFNKSPTLDPLRFESFDRRTGLTQTLALETFSRRELAPFAASQIHAIVQTMEENTGKYPFALRQEWARVEKLTREAGVRRVSQPKIPFWASCTDRARREPMPPIEAVAIRHEDRHPFMAIVLNYRDFENTRLLHLFSEVARPESAAYAGGDAIHLRVFEPKVSWPITGPLDLVDFQTGVGVYHFSSAGFSGESKSFHGWIYEPARFDLHVPGRYADKAKGFWIRLPLSLSYSVGWLMFPGGFSGNKFNGTTPDTTRDIRGNEVVFEQGVVINVGRLFGQ